jgi:hypothetical protein
MENFAMQPECRWMKKSKLAIITNQTWTRTSPTNSTFRLSFHRKPNRPEFSNFGFDGRKMQEIQTTGTGKKEL